VHVGLNFTHPESATGAIWGAYSSLGDTGLEEILLWQSDGIFFYGSHSGSPDFGTLK